MVMVGNGNGGDSKATATTMLLARSHEDPHDLRESTVVALDLLCNANPVFINPQELQAEYPRLLRPSIYSLNETVEDRKSSAGGVNGDRFHPSRKYARLLITCTLFLFWS